MREICTSGFDERGVETEAMGLGTRAPPDERGGKQTSRTYRHRATPRLYRQGKIAPALARHVPLVNDACVNRTASLKPVKA